MKTLSICIPTYNRVVQLEELVKSLLAVTSNDFEVVVTDNCSTDNTLDMLNAIKDDRLVVYKNTSPEPALYNMILSIFNASGKYALYCNDRDIIYTEQLLHFIEFLKNHKYSYIHVPKYHGNPTYKINEYEKGFDSLIHHPFCDHPTGMVFNAEIMKKNLHKEDYKKYIEYIHTFCFLNQDLVIYEKSATYDICLWDPRPSIFKVQSASGTVYKGQLFFDAETTTCSMAAEIEHLIGNPYFSLSSEQQKKLIFTIFIYFKKRLMMTKEYYANARECAHYNIKPRHISFFEMKNVYNHYLKECDNVLRNTSFYEELKEEWTAIRDSLSKSLFRDYILCDKNIIAKMIKQKFIPNYRF